MPPTRSSERADVFVIGLDPTNQALLEGLSGADRRYRFHPLLRAEEVRGVDELPVAAWLERARRELDAFDGEPDAIVSYWHFPVTEMAAVLCAERGLPSPTLTSVLRCQHKYWSRLDHERVIPEATPAFAATDVFAPDAPERLRLS